MRDVAKRKHAYLSCFVKYEAFLVGNLFYCFDMQIAYALQL